MANTRAIESIRKIQEAARLKVQEKLNKKNVPAVAAVQPKEVPAEQRKEIVRKAKRQIHAKIAASVAESFDSLKRSVVATRKQNTQIISDILPQNCRFYQMGANAGTIILEYQPAKRIISIGNEYDDTGKSVKTRNVPFPYFYFVISFRKDATGFSVVQRGIGARNSPLHSVNDRLDSLPLCHTQGNHHVCQPMTKNYYSNLTEMADDFVQNFWRSRFVYPFEAFTVGKKKVNSWADWEKVDLLEMLKVNLRHGSTVSNLLENSVRYDNAADNSAKMQTAVGKSEAAVQNAIRDAVNGIDFETFLDCSLQH